MMVNPGKNNTVQRRARSNLIYHITTRAAWEAAQAAGVYRADSLDAEGFIHCSAADQVARVANAFFRGQAGLVLLVIDPTRLRAPLRYEPPADPTGAFDTGEERLEAGIKR